MTPDRPTVDAPDPHGGRPFVTAGAPRGAATAAVVALHGRGATAQGVVNLLEPAVPRGVTVLAPSAARSRWYPHDATAPRERNGPHLASALAVVDALADRAVERMGHPRERVVLLGFSQGACVVAERAVAAPGPHPLVVLSGSLLGPTVDPDSRVPADADRDDGGPMAGAPAFLASGTDDPHVPAARQAATAAVLRRLGADVTERRYEGVGHEVPDAAFEHVRELLTDLATR